MPVSTGISYRLFDDCQIIFEGDAADLPEAVYRQNGGIATISVPEIVTRTLTLTDGSEAEEDVRTGRAVQVDRLTDVEIRPGRGNEWVVTGVSDQLKEMRLPEEQQSVTFRLIPGERCRSCG